MRWFLSLSLLLPSLAYACPFCDAGGTETALFIILCFGFVALAGVFFFLVFVRRGGLKDADKVTRRVLEVEGLSVNGDTKNE